MKGLEHLLENNRRWSAEVRSQDPSFFARLAGQQRPDYLWIGCSDSRVPANQILGLAPGDVFVHRNIANQVIHSDMNCLSVLDYAVTVLRVRRVIVCGHYGCGGIQAALAGGPAVGLVDNWLGHVRDVDRKYADALAGASPAGRLDRVCELNVFEQVANVCRTTIVESAWDRGQVLAVHGWIYRLEDGLIGETGLTVEAPGDLAAGVAQAVARAIGQF